MSLAENLSQNHLNPLDASRDRGASSGSGTTAEIHHRPVSQSVPATGAHPTEVSKTRREYGIDALRGIAIVAMVASHLARPVLEDHPIWLRAWSSLAAPLFVILAGMMVAQTQFRRGRPLSHYLIRGATIVLLGAWIDAALWGLYPFLSVDVLYLIGVSLPITALVTRLSTRMQDVILVAVLVVSELLRSRFGYPAEVTAVFLWEPWREVVQNRLMILQQWLYCGWFPLFPWLFFAIFGARIFQMRQRMGAAFPAHARRLGLGLICLGLFLGMQVSTGIIIRDDYSELFYPPTAVFVLVASGVVLFTMSFAGAVWLKSNRPLIVLGQCPLLMYVVHLAVIRWGLRPLFTDVSMAEYIVLYGGLVALLVGIAEAISVLKRSEYRLSLVVRMLVGS